ncbi:MULTISPECIES: flagellar hook assembly protein FlgD [unclassified Iodobacter]|uniref:flagellar hook assembly protein FlgD n=1 Tax=unclassified Iodobacter TaxID=235634 RepID=UPI0025CE4A14|nr:MULTISPECIES: flagellar hook capping FlgD N-terminal domain-containing protein [unclassified Iodobacter]MDW5417586.1 flagellar hook capping FlgD N-terminal domain-containing protein [Iodobacter sp. CM08]
MVARTTVNSSTDYAALNQKAGAGKASAADQQQDRFLKLLVKQLQSQDPMNPMDNAATTSQMAQISSVTGIEKLNTTMQTMLASFSAAQSFQAAALIGKEVLTVGNKMKFDGTKPVDTRVDLPSGVSNIKVSIMDKNGLVVDNITLPQQPAGAAAVAWDGKMNNGEKAPAGDYLISARGVQDGKEIALNTLTWQTASSVELAKTGVKVMLADQSSVDFSAVRQIR